MKATFLLPVVHAANLLIAHVHYFFFRAATSLSIPSRTYDGTKMRAFTLVAREENED